MNKVQKLRVGKVRNCNEQHYKTLYKVFDAYGKFLYYQVGTDGMITEYLEDIEQQGYLFYNYQFSRLSAEKIV